MPRWILSERNAELRELMDDPSCDPVRLANTYTWFSRLNPWLARWSSLYHSHVRPAMPPDRPARILDIGCGGGDLLRLIHDLAQKDGQSIELTGIDPDERAIQYARQTAFADRVTLLPVSSQQLVEEGRTFDIVLSNHVLHHLDSQELTSLMADSVALSNGMVLHNDICRDDVAWLAYWPVAIIPAFNSFLLTDGLRSIRRAWSPEELAALLPPVWTIERAFPFRTLLVHRRSV